MGIVRSVNWYYNKIALWVKVASLENITISRLELCSMFTKLYALVMRSIVHVFEYQAIFTRSDSQVVVNWMNGSKMENLCIEFLCDLLLQTLIPFRMENHNLSYFLLRCLMIMYQIILFINFLILTLLVI